MTRMFDESQEVIALHKDEYVHLFFERFLKCDEISVYLLRLDLQEESPETLGVLLRIHDELWFTYIDAPSDEYGEGYWPLRIVSVDTRAKRVEIEFELAFDTILEHTKQRYTAHGFKKITEELLKRIPEQVLNNDE